MTDATHSQERRSSSDGSTGALLGLVDGSTPANTRRFHVVLEDNAIAQLDDLVCTTQTLPDGTRLVHYGIVVENMGIIEGAELPSDTQRITGTRTMPGVTSRRVEVQILRAHPELWIAPNPGAEVRRAVGEERATALFLDQMEDRLAVGLDQTGEPVFADFSFMNGEKGGHISISGISGVATKTSYALFLLYMLFETEDGRRLLGQNMPNTKALVFSVKGEDLLHIDRDNRRLEHQADTVQQWQKLGVQRPGRFRSVALYVPPRPGARHGVAPAVTSRNPDEVIVYGWTPWDFIREGLLRFCLTEDEDQHSQTSFVEQRVRVQLARWAWPVQNRPGAVVLCEPDPTTPFILERVVEMRRTPRSSGDSVVIESFSDLVDFITRKVTPDAAAADLAWTASAAPGTCAAFVRRLYAQVPRIGHLVATSVHHVELGQSINVVDIHGLHDSAQRFVVGALLSRIFDEKQGTGREPLRFIVLDELNKYAPRRGRSPIKDVLVDIAARGRSLGVLLIGAQQAVSEVDGNIIRNAALKVVGRLDAGEAGEYRFLSAELRERATRFLPGTMVLDQPLIPAPIPMRFPFPGFATNPSEGQDDPETRRAEEDDAFGRL
jgi:uncharacterized protein